MPSLTKSSILTSVEVAGWQIQTLQADQMALEQAKQTWECLSSTQMILEDTCQSEDLALVASWVQETLTTIFNQYAKPLQVSVLSKTLVGFQKPSMPEKSSYRLGGSEVVKVLATMATSRPEIATIKQFSRLSGNAWKPFLSGCNAQLSAGKPCDIQEFIVLVLPQLHKARRVNKLPLLTRRRP
jgi:hypothetical protein